MSNYEDELIADMRAHGGTATKGFVAGHPLLILTNEGAKSGEMRRAVLTYSRDADDYVVAGTAGGSLKTPAWVHNVRENPDVTIEVNLETMPADATVVADGSERDRLWEQHVAALPWFADYPEQSGRVIPMVRLTPRR